MSSNSELYVKYDDNHKRIFYLIKELIKDREEISIVANHKSTFNAARAANSIVNTGYASYANIQTLTEIYEGKRKMKLVIKLKKAPEFEKLYAESEERRKMYSEMRENEKKQGTTPNHI